MEKIFSFLLNYWWVIIIAGAALIVVGHKIYLFFQQSREQQIAKLKEWLLYAVAAAEKEFGGGTGALKLRTVYNMFISTFPTMARWISFEDFTSFVDETLEVFRALMESNESINTYVKK